MQKIISILLIGFISSATLKVAAQETRLWTEEDRNYLVDNLTRTRDLIITETAHLTKEQWNFKESPDRWSISEVTEHIAIWELLLDHEVSRALSGGLQPELNKNAKPDSVYLGFILEEKPHISIEYTRPFTYTLPMGLNEGKNNITWFLKLRNESIDYLKTAKEDLRSYYLKASRPNIHQVYITIFGHSERHFRQIIKIKSNANYPKS
jgi:hypothetical protein